MFISRTGKINDRIFWSTVLDKYLVGNSISSGKVCYFTFLDFVWLKLCTIFNIYL